LHLLSEETTFFVDFECPLFSGKSSVLSIQLVVYPGVNKYDEQFIVDLKFIELLICLQVLRNLLITAA